jgi:curved DNA-binding protein CbpA
MKTLYDLLEALPHDDAEGLRAAFRRAVKGVHPDLRPGDPDAALKFRQIVHASGILGDAEQRAAYDDLLEVARLEHEQASGHPVAARIHRLASGVIALAAASAVTVGAYLLFLHMSAASVASANNFDVTTRASLEIATNSPADATPAISVGTSNPVKPTVPSAAMLPTHAESAAEVNAGRGPAISADRDGDLNGPIADLDQAFRLDPKLLPAYLERSVMFYRTRKSSHLFPDAARASRIGKPDRAKSASTIAKKPLVGQAVIQPSVTPWSQRRTAAQDRPRNEGFASALLRRSVIASLRPQ